MSERFFFFPRFPKRFSILFSIHIGPLQQGRRERQSDAPCPVEARSSYRISERFFFFPRFPKRFSILFSIYLEFRYGIKTLHTCQVARFASRRFSYPTQHDPFLSGFPVVYMGINPKPSQIFTCLFFLQH